MDAETVTRLLELLWHVEQGGTFENRHEAVKALYAVLITHGWTPPAVSIDKSKVMG